jgi:hypothetical protein
VNKGQKLCFQVMIFIFCIPKVDFFEKFRVRDPFGILLIIAVAIHQILGFWAPREKLHLKSSVKATNLGIDLAPWVR